MEKRSGWEVGGFRFGSDKDAELAKNEQEKNRISATTTRNSGFLAEFQGF